MINRIKCPLTVLVLSVVPSTSAGTGSGDFDSNGRINLPDFSIFGGCMSGPEQGLASAICTIGDLDANGDVDLVDWRAFESRFGVEPGSPGIGDFDGDGDVDLRDLPILESCLNGPLFGHPGTPCNVGDFDADGDLDLVDIRAFCCRFGHGPPRIDRLAPAPGQQVVSVGGLAEVKVGFTERVQITAGAVTAWTINGGLIPISGITYDQGTEQMAIALAVPIRDERLTLLVDYSIIDLAGYELDGEIANPINATLPSGDGFRGGQAVFRINVLTGDADRNGVVDQLDVDLVTENLGRCSRHAEYDSHADMDENGCITEADVAIVSSSLGNALPMTDGIAPSLLTRTPDVGSRVRAFQLGTVTTEFSEPIRPESINPRALLAFLPNGSLQPAASVEVSATNANFAFDPPLSATANYELYLSQTVTDASGEFVSPILDAKWPVFVDASPTTIQQTSPLHGGTGVAVMRETIFTIRDFVDQMTLTSQSVFATFGGSTIPAMLRPTPDGKRIRLFYEEPGLPAGARVRVTFDSAGIIDDLGQEMDADGDGISGGVMRVDFDTLSNGRIPGTLLFGRVVASERGRDGEDIPLEGVTISVEGFPLVGACDGDPADELCAISDVEGGFMLVDTPAPDFLASIDGGTTTAAGGSPPSVDCTYPKVVKPFHTIPGHPVHLGTEFDIHLPCVADDSMVEVVPGAETTVSLSNSGVEMFATLFPDPDIDPTQLQLTIPPDSLTNDDGTPGTIAAIFPVDSSRLPSPLGSGMVHSFDITIQTGGAGNLETPAPICFPNVPDPNTNTLPLPGAKLELVSFDHDAGQWEPQGPMTVMDADGNGFGERVCTDPGVGIVAPGWHGQAPPPIAPPTCNQLCCSELVMQSTAGPSGNPTSCRPCDKEKVQVCKRRCLQAVAASLVSWDRLYIWLLQRCLTIGPLNPVGAVACVLTATAVHIGCVLYLNHLLNDWANSCECGTTATSTAGAVEYGSIGLDPTVSQITSHLSAFANAKLPQLVDNSITWDELSADISLLLAQVDDIAGGNALSFLEEYRDSLAPKQAYSFVLPRG